MGTQIQASLLTVSLFLFFMFLSRSAQTATLEQNNNNAFHFIKHLVGSQKGYQHVAGLIHLKKYLNKFGYLNLKKHENNIFDDELECAIKAYQRSFHLQSTGKLDEETVEQMMRQRCGVADTVNVKGSQQWTSSKTHLTYRFHSGAHKYENIRLVFAEAFKKWAEVTDFKFEEVPENSAADMEIGFHRGHHGDSEPFDGAGGVIGHVIRQKKSGKKSLEIHLDADEKWSTNPGTLQEMDLESVALHLIGHLLGLNHNTKNSNSVMHPIIEKHMVKRHLQQDDIRSIQDLYGLT